jgi:hypothetical protein
MGKALSGFYRLVVTDRAVDRSRYLPNRMLAAFVHGRCRVKGLTGISKDIKIKTLMIIEDDYEKHIQT